MDEPGEEWQQLTGEESANDESSNEPPAVPMDTTVDAISQASETNGVDVADMTMQVDMTTPPRSIPSLASERSQPASDPVPIPPQLRSQAPGVLDVIANGNEGPITPRNNAGPWVFDGSAGTVALPIALAGRDTALGEMRSIDSTAMDAVSRS